MRISDWSSDVCSADLGSGCSPISRRSQVAKTPVNVAASVKARLLKLAREEHQPFDVLLVRFALARLLYRLSISALRDRKRVVEGKSEAVRVDLEGRGVIKKKTRAQNRKHKESM